MFYDKSTFCDTENCFWRPNNQTSSGHHVQIHSLDVFHERLFSNFFASSLHSVLIILQRNLTPIIVLFDYHASSRWGKNPACTKVQEESFEQVIENQQCSPHPQHFACDTERLFLTRFAILTRPGLHTMCKFILWTFSTKDCFPAIFLHLPCIRSSSFHLQWKSQSRHFWIFLFRVLAVVSVYHAVQVGERSKKNSCMHECFGPRLWAPSWDRWSTIPVAFLLLRGSQMFVEWRFCENREEDVLTSQLGILLLPLPCMDVRHERSQLQSNCQNANSICVESQSRHFWIFFFRVLALCPFLTLLSQRSILVQTMGSKLRQKHNSGCFSFIARFTNVCWVALLWNREEEWSQLGSKWTSEWSPRLSAKTTHHSLRYANGNFNSESIASSWVGKHSNVPWPNANARLSLVIFIFWEIHCPDEITIS